MATSHSKQLDIISKNITVHRPGRRLKDTPLSPTLGNCPWGAEASEGSACDCMPFSQWQVNLNNVKYILLFWWKPSALLWWAVLPGLPIRHSSSPCESAGTSPPGCSPNLLPHFPWPCLPFPTWLRQPSFVLLWCKAWEGPYCHHSTSWRFPRGSLPSEPPLRCSPVLCVLQPRALSSVMDSSKLACVSVKTMMWLNKDTAAKRPLVSLLPNTLQSRSVFTRVSHGQCS